MTDRKNPLGFTLAAMFALCFTVWAATLLYPLYVGALVLTVAIGCGALWLMLAIRRVFDFGSRRAAEFVAGAPRNPLMIDAEYASIQREIEKARTKHAPRKHLYAKRDARLAQMLGAK